MELVASLGDFEGPWEFLKGPSSEIFLTGSIERQRIVVSSQCEKYFHVGCFVGLSNLNKSQGPLSRHRPVVKGPVECVP